MTSVGVVGLGAMGLPVARALDDGGATVRVFDLSAASMSRAVGAGLTAAADLAGLARDSDVVVLSLPTPAVVREVTAQLGVARPDLLVLDTSTNDPDTARTLQRDLAATGGDYADCPVLGRPDRVGGWTIPVGGTDAAFRRAEVVLAVLAQRIVHVGPAGTGAVVKVLNNLMLSAINAVTAEALVLAEAAGLDPGMFVDVVIDSGAASVSGLFRDIAPRAVDGSFDPVFALRLLHKDAGLGVAMAQEYDVPLLVGAAAQTLNTMALEAGHGDEDTIAVVKALEAVTGRRARRHPAGDAAGEDR